MRHFHDAAFEASTIVLDFEVNLDGSWPQVSIHSRGGQYKGQQRGGRFIDGRTANAVEFQSRCRIAADRSVPDEAALALALGSIAATGIPVARKGLAGALRSIVGDGEAAVALVGTKILAEVTA